MAPDGTGRPERRQYDRAVLEVPATAVRRDTPLDHPRRVVGLRVLNVSRGGVGAMASTALAKDEPVVVFFPPMGPTRGHDAHGQVVRCDQVDCLYHVGIVFDEPWPDA